MSDELIHYCHVISCHLQVCVYCTWEMSNSLLAGGGDSDSGLIRSDPMKKSYLREHVG